MLANYRVFDEIDQRIASFFAAHATVYLRGVEPFLRMPDRNFALSRYDGHPNEAAHQIMAEQIRDAVLAHIRQTP
jgi:hypothetical protein